MLSSVTDAYQPIERKYQLTRAILKVLLKYDFPVSILTKSDLVLRDIDLLKQFSHSEVGLTVTTLDEKVSRDFEPAAALPEKRLATLAKLHNNGIKTYAFISPILPGLTDLAVILAAVKGKVDFVMAESLNLKPSVWQNLKIFLAKKYPQLLPKYQAGFSEQYWDEVEKEIKKLSKEFGIPLEGFFRH